MMSDRNFGRHPVTPSPRHPWPLLAAFLVLCLGLEARAESISIIASDNAWVGKAYPDADNNETPVFKVGGNGTAWNYNLTYLRFDVSPLAGGTITSASLDVYWKLISAQSTPVGVLALNDLADGGLGTTETSWAGNLTWNTQPGTATLPNTLTSTCLASLPFAAGDAPRLVSFDLTSALPGLLESDTNNQLTLILYGAGAKLSEFYSLTNTTGKPVPTLSVEYSNPIPEPGTLALLGMALLGLGWYAWRRRG